MRPRVHENTNSSPPPIFNDQEMQQARNANEKKVGKHWHRLEKVLTLKRRAAKVFEFGLLDLHMVIFPFILSADGPGKTHQRWPPVASPKIAWPKTALAKDRFGKTASARPPGSSTNSMPRASPCSMITRETIAEEITVRLLRVSRTG